MKYAGSDTIDIDLIAQRILKLAELSTLEHLESLMRSQADSLLALMSELEREENTRV